VAVDYSRRAPDYDDVRADDATDRGFWLRGLVEVGKIQPRERVLDLGAGTGRFAFLLHTTNRVVALDPSREMLKVASSKAPFACIRGDGHRLPVRADAFDVTIIVMVLQHLADVQAVIREVARVSRRVVIATSDLATRRLGILEEAFPNLLEIDRNRFPRIETIIAALENSGFRDVRKEERPYERTLTTHQQLDRVRRKYLSTFDLLPPGEYERGLRFLEREMPRRFGDHFEMKSSFTFLGGTK
jgi:SAM-dependent methyltransferase